MKKEHNIKVDTNESMSADLQEILSNPPSFLIRYGTIIISLFILLLFAGSFFIHYPDMIHANAVIMPKDSIDTTQLKKNVNFYAVVQLPIAQSGKVRKGQTVILRMPGSNKLKAQEIRGSVSCISLDYNDKKITVFATLPQVAVAGSESGLKLHEQQNISAAIITENKRLIERILGPLTNLFYK